MERVSTTIDAGLLLEHGEFLRRLARLLVRAGADAEDLEDVPAERRNAARGRVLAEIARNGAGPLEPRRKECAARVDQTSPTSEERVSTLWRRLHDCGAKTDCKQRTGCLWPIVVTIRERR
jgi:hypothetical protein